jgi:hypothetical protein
MRTRIAWALLALTLAAATSATAGTTTQTTRPTLALVQHMPLVVRGAHFRPDELVRLTATAGTTSGHATATATRAGRIVARFDYTPPICVRIVVSAVGRRGDHARLVVKPTSGSSGVPCGL